MKERKTEGRTTAADYLKLPYMQLVVPDDDGTFRAEVVEFPGCIATGETRQAALESLQDVAESWLESMLARGQAVPAPLENTDFSGKLVLRMPRSLHRKAALAAERDGVSLNQFIVSSVAENIGGGRVPRPAPQVMIFTQPPTTARNLGPIRSSGFSWQGGGSPAAMYYSEFDDERENA